MARSILVVDLAGDRPEPTPAEPVADASARDKLRRARCTRVPPRLRLARLRVPEHALS